MLLSWLVLCLVPSFPIILGQGVTDSPEPEECDCECDYFDMIISASESNLTQAAANLTKEEKVHLIEDKLESTKKALQVNSTATTSSKIKKISAKDDRPSSARLGYLGIALLVAVPSFLIILDLMSLSTHLAFLRRNLNLHTK